ncbi:MAG: sigma factor-like helix-turn-helix DNA-binding protein [Myxococcota bacterium]|nr:sigma factor-like helix-turn-helix DNA-binding protein [Myxococcota bacterium]
MRHGTEARAVLADDTEQDQRGCCGPAPDEARPAGAAGRREARSRRKRSVGAKTFAIRRISKEELRLGAILFPDRDYWRPGTRGECKGAERPCPYVACRHHLYLDVTPQGSIKFNFPDSEVWDLRETCALDVAERTDGVTLEEAGEIMNLTRERIRQIEASAMRRLVEAGIMELAQHRAGEWRAVAAEGGDAERDSEPVAAVRRRAVG